LRELSRIAPGTLAGLQRQLPDAEACLLFLQAGTEQLTLAQSTPLLQSALKACTFQLGRGVAGWVAAHRYRIVNSDPALDLGDVASSLNLRSCMSVPVFAFGDLIGVLSVYLPQPHGFADREVHLVGVIAQEIGVDVVPCDEGGSAASKGSAVPVTWPARPPH
jgi:GAF domain-containing protein